MTPPDAAATPAPTPPPSASRVWSGQSVALLCYAALVLLLCLRRWGTPHPWSRLDPFSGGYLLLSFGLATQQAVFAARFTQSAEVKTVFYSLRIDPGFSRWAAVLGLAEAAAFLDYAHWHLVPALDRPFLKGGGLALYLVTVAWLVWVDRFLYRHFAPATERGALLTTGPYRHVRHPRYTGLLSTRIAFPLMLASPIAWCLSAGWMALVLRRIRKEESWLRARFGCEYDDYAGRTPAIIPALRQ